MSNHLQNSSDQKVTNTVRRRVILLRILDLNCRNNGIETLNLCLEFILE